MEKKILNAYTTAGHETYYSGLQNTFQFWKKSAFPKLTLKKLTKILSKNEGYTRHRQVKKDPTNPTYVYFKRDSIQLDLVDISKFSKFNDGKKFLLTAIDAFTKFAQCQALKNKTQDSVLSGFKEVLKRFGQKPLSIYVDSGKEFTNNQFKQYLSKNKIKPYFAKSSKYKAAMVERLNQSLKKMIYSFMTDNETYNFLPKLQKIVKTYNSRIHSALPQITPQQAEKNDVKTAYNIRQKNELKYMKVKEAPIKHAVGENVRISTAKNVFSRGYNPQYQNEVFKVNKINKTLPRPRYELTDYNNKEIIDGLFTNNELQLVTKDTFDIEEILQTKTDRRGVNHYLVKFKDYKQPEWIKENQIVTKKR